jgi:hypothetical protein
MAKAYLQGSGKKSVCIIPIGHAGFEKSVKVWVIRNRLILEKIVRPFVNYPYIAFSEASFHLTCESPHAVGHAVRLTLADLRTERKMTQAHERLPKVPREPKTPRTRTTTIPALI